MSPRIGIHLSTAGGPSTAIARAREVGAAACQIFSSSPRTWRPANITPDERARMHAAREAYCCTPLVIHASYLINMSSQSEEVLTKSVFALRGELERALELGAQLLVLHPGSWRGMTRDQGLARAAEAIAAAVDGLDTSGFRLLIENTAGSEYSLGGSFDQVAELIDRLHGILPVGACLDTCHTHVAGYDMTTKAGFRRTMAQIHATIGLGNVFVWHMNDATAARGSKLDRHQHIGEGQLGLEPFRWLLNDRRFAHCAFIAETPVDEPGDIAKNVRTLFSLTG